MLDTFCGVSDKYTCSAKCEASTERKCVDVAAQFQLVYSLADGAICNMKSGERGKCFDGACKPLKNPPRIIPTTGDGNNGCDNVCDEAGSDGGRDGRCVVTSAPMAHAIHCESILKANDDLQTLRSVFVPKLLTLFVASTASPTKVHAMQSAMRLWTSSAQSRAKNVMVSFPRNGS